MVEAPQVSLKVIVVVQFVLTVWASMAGEVFLGNSYIYMNAFTLLFGFWAIVNNDSVDAVFMYMLLNTLNILLDVIFLGVNTGSAKVYFEQGSGVHLGEFRFSLGMAIVNLILRPFASFVLFRIYQERRGQDSDFTMPGLPRFSSRPGPGYEPIGQPQAPAQAPPL